MINRTVLLGRLTKDPELRTTGSGVSVATFTLAINRPYTNSQGHREADFISCVIWRKAAENFCNFTEKGSLVGIDGRIQTRSYEDKNGRRIYVTEVVVENFSLLESRKDREARDNGNAGHPSNNNGSNTTASPSPTPSDTTKPKTDNTPDPFANSGDTIDISDDDLPF